MISNEKVLILPVVQKPINREKFPRCSSKQKSSGTGCRNPPAVFSYLTGSCSEDKTLLGERGERVRGNEQRKFVPQLSVITEGQCPSLSQGFPFCQSAGELGICTRATVSSCGQKLLSYWTSICQSHLVICYIHT